jgi:hypothetical protein
MSAHDKARILVVCWEAIGVLLVLTMLAGCQGLSTGGKSTPPPQRNDSAGSLGVSPLSLDFGSVPIGNNQSLPVALTNVGNSGSAVTVFSVNVSNADFTVSGLSFPVTIAAGQGAQFAVTFTPRSTGLTSGTASFVSDASNSPTFSGVSGTGGAQPVQHSVALSWTASASPDITGYNIYRSGISGGPYSKLNSSLNPGTNYTDSTVADGSTYYYVTTAINSDSEESAYSDPVQIEVP